MCSLCYIRNPAHLHLAHLAARKKLAAYLASVSLVLFCALSMSPACAQSPEILGTESFITNAGSIPGPKTSPNQLRIYVDGTLQGATDFSGGWRATGHSEIGRGMFGGKPVDFVDGSILDARVYGKALSDSEVRGLYEAGPDPRWQFDRTSSHPKATSLQNQGTFLGGACWLSSYYDGNLNLNGSSAYIDIHKGVLDTSQSYTVSAWVRLRSSDGFQTFVSQDGVNLSGFYLQKRGDDNKFALTVRAEDKADPSWVMAESTIVPQVNVLYHVVGVYSKVQLSPLVWDPDRQGRLLLCSCRDQQGKTWVGTEGQGVWRFDPRAASHQQWTQFTQKEGLGDDNIYTLCCDSAGRIWAGTLNHGVSVFNGKEWQTYGPLDGPIGARVFSLATNPADGDVWGATEAGLFRYSAAKHRPSDTKNAWSCYTRADGLPSSAAVALAFNQKGDLFVATEADGLAIASKADNYRKWRTVRGPVQLPRTAGGAGLPTNLTNCLLVTRAGVVYCGTDVGLARSEDSGKTWHFVRGTDWADKLEGLSSKKWLDGDLVDNADVRAIEVDPLQVNPLQVNPLKTKPNLLQNELSPLQNELSPLQVLLESANKAAGKETVVGKETESDDSIHIAAGGTEIGEWKDRFFSGGQVFHSSFPVDASTVLNPAPQSVYQGARWGSFTYTIPSLRPGASYRVRLHFAEVAWDRPGQRTFNVTINGRRLLTHFDIVAVAGAKNKATLKEFIVQADPEGRITLAFRGAQPLPALDVHSPNELSEDYVTALAEDGAGNLLVGHRQSGLEIINPASGEHLFPRSQDHQATDFVTALLPQSDGSTLMCSYGDGLITQPGVSKTSSNLRAISPPQSVSPSQTASRSAMATLGATSVPMSSSSSSQLPSPAMPPSLKELNALMKAVVAVAPDPRELNPKIVTLNDDWLTKGDWLGRYGRYWASMPGCCSPSDYLWGAGWEQVGYHAQLGPNHAPSDSLRYWVQTLYTTDPRNLELPPTYLDSRIKKGLTTGDVNRRDSSQDDHGETYPSILEGPHIYTTLAVPKGLFYLSLYEFNRQAGGCRDRDYRISVRLHPGAANLADNSAFEGQSELAHGRVHQYYGGVYKRFLVRGPQVLTIQLNRNNSWNTELDGVMLDLVDETPAPYFQPVLQWKSRQAGEEAQWHHAVQARQSVIDANAQAPAFSSEAEAANRLFDLLETLRTTNSTWWATEGRRYYLPLCRWYAEIARETAFSVPPRLYTRLGTCYYQIGMYAQWEKCQRQTGLTPARDIEKALRWDGISDSGQGFQVVTDHLALHDHKKLESRKPN